MTVRLTPIASKVARQFNRRAMDVGWRRASAGEVRILKGNAVRVEALVGGSGPRSTTLIETHKKGAHVVCTCASYHAGRFCHHLWATLLIAEQEGHLDTLKSLPQLQLISDYDPANGLDLPGDDEDPADEDPIDEELEDPRGGEDNAFDLVADEGPSARLPASAPTWKSLLDQVSRSQDGPSPGYLPPNSELVYWMVPERAPSRGTLLHLGVRKRKVDGTWGRIQPRHTLSGNVLKFPSPDRHLLMALSRGNGDYLYLSLPSALDEAQLLFMLPLLARSGRFFLGPEHELDGSSPLEWDGDLPWTVRFRLEGQAGKTDRRLCARLHRGSETVDSTEVPLLLKEGYFIAGGKLRTFRCAGGPEWMAALQGDGIKIPKRDLVELRRGIFALPDPPDLEWPDELRLEEVAPAPRPSLRLFAPKLRDGMESPRLFATASIRYDELQVPISDLRPRIFDEPGKRIVRRDLAFVESARRRLLDLGFLIASEKWWASQIPHDFEIAPKNLPRAVVQLLESGWHVEAEKGVFRKPGSVKCSISSGVDWFDLAGGVEFDGEVVPFPKLLAALREKRTFVTLGDGSQGILPEEWLRKMGFLLGAAAVKGDLLRFRPTQAMLLDALLAAQEGSTCDETFGRIRKGIRSFDGVAPLEPPPGFRGELRPYQKLGLGWMAFLREFRLGGCLADDMGLGKTIQVLALLQSRRLEGKGPSLVVVPRSLIFNWKSEAARFAPDLRIVDHSGLDRSRDAGAFRGADIVLTTYGTLRRDAPYLKDVSFDYVVLDEAQAIKNASSASAKAARLLRGTHRLALSGTPIENHLGELWSLFEFLNPGMLGRASVFDVAMSGGDSARGLLGRALRPFILRREKREVATELPEKVEQTLACDLGADERVKYDELRRHYQALLAGRIETEGLGRSKMHILEALLRLRQAACHPGLMDPALRDRTSTKVELLLERLREVVDEGHKALVFSQFTSLLGIVRGRLEKEKIVYEYLDGGTRDRGARVERFQKDPACPVFLISLKAGGLGLNLTAAEYVFLLDPWWNPAAEAQAIDRTHRIGQTRQVFACRLVARDTVEEKILQLQEYKRDLADAIINADNSLLTSLTREDLELLLS